MARYYLDTSIWLDLFEERNEPQLPKSDYAESFIASVISKSEKIIYSDAIVEEVAKHGYGFWEVERLFERFRRILVYVEAGARQFKRAKDLAAKRSIPVMDALHALIARDYKVILVSRDKDFDRLRDIVETKKPEDF